jgi:hypothetical protein
MGAEWWLLVALIADGFAVLALRASRRTTNRSSDAALTVTAALFLLVSFSALFGAMS